MGERVGVSYSGILLQPRQLQLAGALQLQPELPPDSFGVVPLAVPTSR